MKHIKWLSTVVFFFVSFCAFAQKYFLSPALDIPQAGWNKVLCMKNGNTLLFHFEPDKNIQVTVFDSLHNQLAVAKDPSKYIDVFNVQDLEFKGAYDIGGEAVLFLDVERDGKHLLVRDRFNATTGKLIENTLAGESASHLKRTNFYVMKLAADSGYAILFSTDDAPFKKANVHVTYYNCIHGVLRDIDLPVDRGKYDFLNVLGAEIKKEGILVTLSLDKEASMPGQPTTGLL